MSSNKLVQLLNQYDSEHTILETGKTVNIRPITTGQMKSILQYEDSEDLSVVDKILDNIINGCVVTDGFNVDGLTLQDRFELLIGIRKISKGNIYNFNIKCPKCGAESIQAVDIEKLTVIPYPSDIDRKVKINKNLTVYLDFIRRGTQKEAEKLVEGLGKLTDNQRRSEIATYMYALSMTKFETNVGEVKDISIQDKKEFIDNLSAKTYETINKWYESSIYGTVFKYTVTCKASPCTFTQDEDIPITGFFF
jgi:hypothetical protein